MFILRVQEKNVELERQESFEKRMEVFDNMLIECKDALQGIKDEIGVEMVRKMLITLCLSFLEK